MSHGLPLPAHSRLLTEAHRVQPRRPEQKRATKDGRKMLIASLAVSLSQVQTRALSHLVMAQMCKQTVS